MGGERRPWIRPYKDIISDLRTEMGEVARQQGWVGWAVEEQRCGTSLWPILDQCWSERLWRNSRAPRLPASHVPMLVWQRERTCRLYGVDWTSFSVSVPRVTQYYEPS